MWPMIAMGLSAGLSSIYHVGKAYESWQYWKDYERNTGVRVRYPFRAGKYDYLDEFGRSFGSIGTYGYHQHMYRSRPYSRRYRR